jgi:hypothetical protein
MRTLLDPLSFLVVSLSGWMNQHQQQVIHYLIEENRVLREQIGNRRMRFSDDQRRRLAARAKAIGGSSSREIATIVTPEPLLAWHRKRIAQKCQPRSMTTTNGGRDCRSGDAHGNGESKLGLSSDSRSISNVG